MYHEHKQQKQTLCTIAHVYTKGLTDCKCVIFTLFHASVLCIVLTWFGCLLRQAETNSLKGREKFPDSSGGGFLGIRNNTRMGCMSELGGSPLASSIAVMPNDHMSAFKKVKEK